MDMICNEEKITRALLVSVDTGGFDAEASLAEKMSYNKNN